MFKDILERGVEDIIVKSSLEEKLKSGRKLRVKLGFDPTGSKIHIGRAIVLRKLKAFQDLGHKVVFVVGDFTAQIGDPSDKLEKRPMLDKKVIQENLKTYKKQVGKVIDLSKAEFYYNSKWLSKLGFQEIGELAESFSVQQMSNRRNFKERLDRGEEVSLREFLYPIMQGYDSVKVKADIEIGGFDQLFNLKAGRIIQKHYGQPEQDILTTTMLEGTDGRKMSTSWGNVINITDEPNDMYGKIMSLKDELITKYFLLCTDLSTEEIEKIKTELSGGSNPKIIKMRLAREIVTLYHDKVVALKAEENFENTFKKGDMPEDALKVEAKQNSHLAELLVENKIVESKTEFSRLIKDSAISEVENGEKITDRDFKISKDLNLRIGKKRFVKIIVR
ncbi:MAG: tyrosine--tRNA ligase [bacterium]